MWHGVRFAHTLLRNSIELGAERYADFRQHLLMFHCVWTSARILFRSCKIRLSFWYQRKPNQSYNLTNERFGSVDVDDEVKQIIPILFPRSSIIRHSHTRFVVRASFLFYALISFFAHCFIWHSEYREYAVYTSQFKCYHKNDTAFVPIFMPLF